MEYFKNVEVALEDIAKFRKVYEEYQDFMEKSFNQEKHTVTDSTLVALALSYAKVDFQKLNSSNKESN